MAMERWSKEKIWDWYNARPWMRGCNYMSADCANRIDQWQELGFEDRWETNVSEVELMAQTGFNTVRIIPEFVVWQKEHDGFFERFDRYLELFDAHGMGTMVVLANDCMPPRSEDWKMPDVGEQHYDWGYHGGRKRSQHGRHNEPAPHYYFDDPTLREEYFTMVREIVMRYREDERVCVWDVYNEPGNSRRKDITMPHLVRMFETVRACNPTQPLTAGVWSAKPDESVPLTEVEQYALDHSDIVSYHCYQPYPDHIRIIKRLKKEGRPLMNTEWLARCMQNTVFDLIPLFYLEKIGCYNWGFVAGKYQTYEPWEGMWDRYAEDPHCTYDMTVWFHDLYRPNHRPYDPKEIALIQEFCQYAEEER